MPRCAVYFDLVKDMGSSLRMLCLLFYLFCQPALACRDAICERDCRQFCPGGICEANPVVYNQCLALERTCHALQNQLDADCRNNPTWSTARTAGSLLARAGVLTDAMCRNANTLQSTFASTAALGYTGSPALAALVDYVQDRCGCLVCTDIFGEIPKGELEVVPYDTNDRVLFLRVRNGGILQSGSYVRIRGTSAENRWLSFRENFLVTTDSDEASAGTFYVVKATEPDAARPITSDAVIRNGDYVSLRDAGDSNQWLFDLGGSRIVGQEGAQPLQVFFLEKRTPKRDDHPLSMDDTIRDGDYIAFRATAGRNAWISVRENNVGL